MDNYQIARLILLIIVFGLLVSYLTGFLMSQTTGSCVFVSDDTCECGITTEKTCNNIGGNFEEFLDCDTNARRHCPVQEKFS
jgi:hypothetical protein